MIHTVVLTQDDSVMTTKPIADIRMKNKGRGQPAHKTPNESNFKGEESSMIGQNVSGSRPSYEVVHQYNSVMRPIRHSATTIEDEDGKGQESVKEDDIPLAMSSPTCNNISIMNKVIQ